MIVVKNLQFVEWGSMARPKFGRILKSESVLTLKSEI
jgi:hypothetical protein